METCRAMGCKETGENCFLFEMFHAQSESSTGKHKWTKAEWEKIMHDYYYLYLKKDGILCALPNVRELVGELKPEYKEE